jgi:hypothetical protein
VQGTLIDLKIKPSSLMAYPGKKKYTLVSMIQWDKSHNENVFSKGIFYGRGRKKGKSSYN